MKTISGGKRTQHMNIRYFFINNQIKTGNLIVECCQAYAIWSGDYWCMSKPLHKEISRIPKNDSQYENRWSELIVKDTADT